MIQNSELRKNDMTSRLLFVKSVVLIAALLFHPDNLFSESKNELPGMEWKHFLGEANFRHDAHAMALVDRDILIAGVAALPGVPDSPERLWLWRVNRKGDKIQEIQINNPYESQKSGRTDPSIKGIAAAEDGGILLVIEFFQGQPSIVKIDKKFSQLFVKSIVEPSRHVAISKILPTSDKNFFLIGHEIIDKSPETSLGEDAFLMKIDGMGNSLWSKTTDRGKTESWVHGLPTDDGGVVLVGNRGSYQQLFIGYSEVWIAKVDSKGKIQSEKTFLGRYGSLAKTQEGPYAIVYDRSNSVGQDIRIRALGSDLRELWETQLLKADPGFTQFQIVPVPNGDFIVGGSKRGSLWVSRISAKGKQMWEFREKSIGMFESIRLWFADCRELIASNNDFFVLSSGYSFNEKRQLNTKVGLIKFMQR